MTADFSHNLGLRTRLAQQKDLHPLYGCLRNVGRQSGGEGQRQPAVRQAEASAALAPSGERASVCPAWPSAFFMAAGRGGGARRDGVGRRRDRPEGTCSETLCESQVALRVGPRQPSNPTIASPPLRDSFSFPSSSLGKRWDFRFHLRVTSGKS